MKKISKPAPPPDSVANLRGRLHALKIRVAQDARSSLRDGETLNHALLRHQKEKAAAFSELRRRLKEVQTDAGRPRAAKEAPERNPFDVLRDSTE